MGKDQPKGDPIVDRGPQAPVSPRAPAWMDSAAEAEKARAATRDAAHASAAAATSALAARMRAGERLNPPEPQKPAKPKRKRRSFFAWLCVILFDICVLAVVAVVLVFLVLAGRPLPAPAWLSERVEARLSEGLGGGFVELGGISVTVARSGKPSVSFDEVRVTTADGAELIAVPSMDVGLDKARLIRGQVQPQSLILRGADLRLSRSRDGVFNVDFGGGEEVPNWPQSFVGFIEIVDSVFALPSLAPIDSIEARDLSLRFADAQSGRFWQVDDGQLAITQDAAAVEMRMNLALGSGPGAGEEEGDVAEQAAQVSVGFRSVKGSPQAEMTVQVDGVPARDLAAQSPALAFLQLLDAPLSGALRTQVSASGELGDLAGTLEIGEGRLTTGLQPIPVRFSSGRSYFRYDPQAGKVSFDELIMSAEQGEVKATGHAYLQSDGRGQPDGLVAQLQFTALRLDPEGVFARAAAFEQGAADIKVGFAPFRAQIGQLVLMGPEAQVTATGRVAAQPDGWDMALDLDVEEIAYAAFLDLWPVQVAPKTRDWLEKNVTSGRLFNLKGGLRRRPTDTKNFFSAVFEFDDAVLRPVPNLPLVTGAAGYASLSEGRFSAVLDAGQAEALQGGPVQLGGTGFLIKNLAIKPVMAQVDLRTSSTITAGLSVLNSKGLAFLDKAGQPVDLAQGRAQGSGRLTFPIKPKLGPGEVQFDVSAVLEGVSSSKIVAGYALSSERAEVQADNARLLIEAPGRIAGIPMRARFERAFAPGAAAQVSGTVQISDAFVKAFNLGLPEGMVSGSGPARFSINLAQGRAPAFTLSSELNGVGLRISELAWSHGRNSRGSLAVSGALGAVPRVDSLKLQASGLTAEGKVTLNPGGGLKTAEFSRIAVGGWIDAPVTLTGRGRGASPAVAVRGGLVDVRKTSFAQGGGGGPAGGPISLALDRLVISEGIVLRRFRADLSQRGGLNGSFTGSVNGQAEVNGTLVPSSGGTAVRIQSGDAGKVIRAAGLFKKGYGGQMSLTLVPRAQAGQYNGALKVSNVRVQSAPGLSALLNAISIVGLLDQLNGNGILFADVEADFLLTPTYVQVNRASGVGPSLGISMAGVYDMVRDQLRMQGVFSPIYVVNGIGQIFSKKGEGLFGFNYSMTGTTVQPKVAVNPLSVFTPGMFREIFRKPPPKVQE
ncbi:hypothetical protein IV417_03480 [Alphaproteobacteria bacterium KMM 3653]|uniref:YhdP central domain-containing protein n=1 Tax=Harenicola maris TaxID=2841044 RepID=A0AAP2CMR7_9RHOB|nr:hypothetical protein [Harenicola maris]